MEHRSLPSEEKVEEEVKEPLPDATVPEKDPIPVETIEKSEDK